LYASFTVNGDVGLTLDTVLVAVCVTVLVIVAPGKVDVTVETTVVGFVAK
jgi:hypothetical protein